MGGTSFSLRCTAAKRVTYGSKALFVYIVLRIAMTLDSRIQFFQPRHCPKQKWSDRTTAVSAHLPPSSPSLGHVPHIPFFSIFKTPNPSSSEIAPTKVPDKQKSGNVLPRSQTRISGSTQLNPIYGTQNTNICMQGMGSNVFCFQRSSIEANIKIATVSSSTNM